MTSVASIRGVLRGLSEMEDSEAAGYEDYGRQLSLRSDMEYGEASSDDLSSEWEADNEPENDTPRKVSRRF